MQFKPPVKKAEGIFYSYNGKEYKWKDLVAEFRRQKEPKEETHTFRTFVDTKWTNFGEDNAPTKLP